MTANPLVSCRTGADNQCADHKTIGVQEPGGFAELVRVPVGQLIEVPAGLGDIDAATTEPLA